MEPIISIQNLRKSYGDKLVLKGINLNIYPGQVIGYIGPNGAGKSTTVKILCGLLGDFEGGVYVKGVNLADNAIAVKSYIGYIPEQAELYDVLTPAEFLGFMADLYGMDERLARDRMTKMLGAFGLQGNMNDRMDTFSKGMKQKVLITSGLLHNPDIIILDEPLSGLDANSVIIVKELISKLAKEGKTIFYCSHMMDVVEKVSDRIVLINEGTVIADGSFDELKQQQGNESLEKIFAHLTAKESLNDAADQLMSAFD
ncbi:MAG TPA: ABC transporter ATP-binding protein [Chitinophagaceae bacterium]|nr:ABC transporter ATP-binding protein [Chitinophagaceae bacterium]